MPPEYPTRADSPQVVKRGTQGSDSSQESNDAIAVYDATKHKLRLWKNEPLAGNPKSFPPLIVLSDAKRDRQVQNSANFTSRDGENT
jgi:hypothetical protein